MRNGIRAASHLGYRKIHVEGDNQILIQAIQDQIATPWQIQSLVQNIKIYLASFTNVFINHIFREGNSAADWVAKFRLTIQSSLVWDRISHRELLHIITADSLGRTLERRAS